MHCQCRRALHHCGDPDRFQTTGLTSVDSLESAHARPRESVKKRSRRGNSAVFMFFFWCFCCMISTFFLVPSPPHTKLSACVQPIKVAIMRHGSTWISSIGAALNHIMMSMTDEFFSTGDQRRIGTTSRKDVSAIVMSEPFALFMNVQPFARVRQLYAKICISSRSDLMTFRVRIQ